jgi:hypothetical protein
MSQGGNISAAMVAPVSLKLAEELLLKLGKKLPADGHWAFRREDRA